jgi:hypothetical protein
MKYILFVFLIVFVSSLYSFLLKPNSYTAKSFKTAIFASLEKAPYDDIIPFLSEHIQPSDQLLFLGAQTDMAIQLALNGYGTKKTGFMTVIDESQERIDSTRMEAEANPVLLQLLNDKKLSFIRCDFSSMSQICRQSTFDAIVDYGGIDQLIRTRPMNDVLKCIDHLQDAVRLGNILVCLSKLEKDAFCEPFEKRFGWVQELDGDPGEISAWYRGKTNIAASKSNFMSHGLKMYVYTNTDNC